MDSLSRACVRSVSLLSKATIVSQRLALCNSLRCYMKVFILFAVVTGTPGASLRKETPLPVADMLVVTTFSARLLPNVLVFRFCARLCKVPRF